AVETKKSSEAVLSRNSSMLARFASTAGPTTALRLAPVPTSPPETIATFAVDCTTPKTTFTLGETVCAQTANVIETNRFVNWLSPPDSHIAYGGASTSAITSNPQNFYYTPQTLGTWKVTIADPSDSSIIPTVFTISAPAPAPSFVF